MYIGVSANNWGELSFINGRITAQQYIETYCPIRIRNAVAEYRDGWVWVYDSTKRKPWEQTDKDYRATASYKDWRKSVFVRDDYTCKTCGQRGGKLEAHHIKTFNKHPNLRFEVSNGSPCHLMEHRGAKNAVV